MSSKRTEQTAPPAQGIGNTLRLGAAFARSLFSYYVDGIPRPFSASFSVTNRCNLRCAYCNFPFLRAETLEPERIAILFRRLHALGVRRLGLLGGEPLVRPDIGELVALARRTGFFVSLSTNLTLYHQARESVQAADVVFTSLDGRPETHRENRGKRSLDGVMEAITELGRSSTPVVATCVLTEANINDIGWLLDTAERLNFRVHFQPQCVDTEIVRGEISPRISNARWRAVWRHLRDQKRRGRAIASSGPYLDFLAEWEDFGVSAYYAPEERCAAGVGFLYVDPLGHAYPCAYTKGRVRGVDLLQENWRAAFDGTTPCTTCAVGPMLEFNLLHQRPATLALHALRSYM